jgi:hypothetical protein
MTTIDGASQDQSQPQRTIAETDPRLYHVLSDIAAKARYFQLVCWIDLAVIGALVVLSSILLWNADRLVGAALEMVVPSHAVAQPKPPGTT